MTLYCIHISTIHSTNDALQMVHFVLNIVTGSAFKRKQHYNYRWQLQTVITDGLMSDELRTVYTIQDVISFYSNEHPFLQTEQSMGTCNL